MPDDQPGALSRRGFMMGAAAASLGTMATAAGVRPASADPLLEVAVEPHGTELRGLELVLDEPFAEGRFGYMFKGQPPHGASEDLLTALGQTMEEKPVIGTNLTDPETGEPVLNTDGSPTVVNKDHNDALGENPNPLLTSGFTFVGQFIDHDITFDTTTLSEQQADPQGDDQLPHTALRPRRRIWAGAEQGPSVLRPEGQGQVPDRQASLQRDQGRPHHVRRGVRRAARRQRQGDHRGPPQRPDVDPRPAACGTAAVPQQTRGLRPVGAGVHAVSRAVGVREGSASGPVALPVDGHPRLPACHRGQGHDGLGVQGGADRGSDHQPQALPDG